MSLTGLLVYGCAADPETTRITDTFPIATTIGSASDLSRWMLVDLDARTEMPESERAELRASAQLLGAHADSLHAALERYDRREPQITLANLEARADALRWQRLLVMREWAVWQIRHGLRAPDDVGEIFDIETAMAE